MNTHQLKQIEHLEGVPALLDEARATLLTEANWDYKANGVVMPVSGDLLARQWGGVEVVSGDDLR